MSFCYDSALLNMQDLLHAKSGILMDNRHNSCVFEFLLSKNYFGFWVYPKVSLVINQSVGVSVDVSVCVSIFKYLRDYSSVFSETVLEIDR